jgi:hypothetical protein
VALNQGPLPLAELISANLGLKILALPCAASLRVRSQRTLQTGTLKAECFYAEVGCFQKPLWNMMLKECSKNFEIAGF